MSQTACYWDPSYVVSWDARTVPIRSSYQQNQVPQQTRPFQAQSEPQQPYGSGQMFQGVPQQQPYQPMFNNNGQVTGQTGAFGAVPQTEAMATDSHGVPGFLQRKK